MKQAEIPPHGVHRVVRYNESSTLMTKIFSACLFLDEEYNILARGVSIRSVDDQYNSNVAKNKSFGRAMKALVNKTHGDPINSYIKRWKNNVQSKSQSIIIDGDGINDFIYSTEVEKSVTQSIVSLEFNTTPTNDLNCTYKLHKLYSLLCAQQYFTYKSMYRPNATERERKLIKKLKGKVYDE